MYEKPILGAAYYPEDWPEDQIDFDIARMKEVGINTARIAEFAWHRMEPKEGEFDFSFFKMVVKKLSDAGIAVVLGTPTATPPIWLARKHPEAFRLAQDGRRREHGGRRNFCSNNPDYNRYCLRITEKMAQAFADEPAVIGWQIDNEIYSSANDGCYCPHCVSRFRERLKEKFVTPEAMNEAWDMNIFSEWYDSFDDVPAPSRPTWHNPHLLTEWQNFINDSHVAFVHRQAEILHKYVKVPVGTDSMPLNGMDYRKMNEKLDVVQFNHYNTPDNLQHEIFWFNFLRTLKPDQPFWNTETAVNWNGSTAISQSIKPEGYNRVNSWLPIAEGAEANMYWIWRTHWGGHELMHGAVIDTSGRDMLTTGEVTEVAKGYKACADFISHTKPVSEVAMHFSSLVWNMHQNQNIVNDMNYSSTVINRFFKPVLESGINADVIDAAESLDRYKVVFSPMLMTLEEHDLASRISEWVKAGGTWVVGPMTDIRDIHGARYRDRYYGMLEELTGTRWCYNAPDREGRIKARWNDGTEFVGSMWYEMSDDADALARITEGHSAIMGKSVLTVKNVGKGRVIIIGSIPSEDDMKRIVKLACDKGDVNMPNVFGKVALVPRKGGEYEGLIAIEYGNAKGGITLEKPMTDLISGKQYSGKTELAPYQVLVLKA